MSVTIPDSERRWLHALLVVGTLTVSLIFLGLLAGILGFFSDILLIFFLAWLLAFILSPVVDAIDRSAPSLPRPVVVILTYVVLLVVLLGIILAVAGSLASSIGNFVTNVPDLQRRLPEVLAPWQAQLQALGLQVDLVGNARTFLAGLGDIGGQLVQPLSDVALASLGVFGNVLLILLLSLYAVIDGDRIAAFLVRLVPQRYSDEARLFEASVAASFGGFLRGQAIMGLVYGLVALVTHIFLRLDYGPASAAASGLLMAIPFFGPFVAWAPPVLTAILTRPDATLWALIAMGVGWFVVMNFVQPRLMASAVGIPPVVVLASVIIGLKIAGIPGAIFGIPIAAVVSSFFFYYLNRASGGRRDVTSRAARRLSLRLGRPVRAPAAPDVSAQPERAGAESLVPGATRAPDMLDAVPASQSAEPVERGA